MEKVQPGVEMLPVVVYAFIFMERSRLFYYITIFGVQ